MVSKIFLNIAIQACCVYQIWHGWQNLSAIPALTFFCLRLRKLHCSWDEIFTWHLGPIPFPCLGHLTLRTVPWRYLRGCVLGSSSQQVCAEWNIILNFQVVHFFSVHILSEDKFYKEKTKNGLNWLLPIRHGVREFSMRQWRESPLETIKYCKLRVETMPQK